MIRFTPLTLEEIASSGGYTHRLDLSYGDIPAGIAVNTAYVWNVAPLPQFPISTIVRRVLLHLIIPFKKTGVAGFNTTTVSLGDAGSATRFISASETNENGTEVLNVTPGAVENYVYTAAGQLQLTMNSMAAQTISDLNVGQLYILMQIDKAHNQARIKAPPFASSFT